MAANVSSFLSLPTEIRLMIYELLIFPSSPSNAAPASAKNIAGPDYHHYGNDGSQHGGAPDDFVLEIRTLDPTKLQADGPASLRTRYGVRANWFRSRTMDTTYVVSSNPGIDTSILKVNKQCHCEAAGTLYSSYTLSFDTHIEAIVPFLSDLTPFARSRVRRLSLVKRALPYTKEFDRCEWAAACDYLARNLRISHLYLGVVAGKPGLNGWDDVPPLRKEHFEMFMTHQQIWPKEAIDMEWAFQLLAISGLQDISVRAIVERCPLPVSTAMRFWVALSKSIEDGFGEWVRDTMVIR